MLRRKMLVVVMTLGLFVLGTGAAQAWTVVASKSGHGTVTLRAWTKNYNQVAFVANHAGTRIHIGVVVDCRNGDHYDNTWTDGGQRFRFVLGGMGNSGRCIETFRVAGASAVPTLTLVIAGQG